MALAASLMRVLWLIWSSHSLGGLLHPGAVLVQCAHDFGDTREHREQGGQEDQPAQEHQELPDAVGRLQDLRENRQGQRPGHDDDNDSDMPLILPYLAILPGVHRLSPKNRIPLPQPPLLYGRNAPSSTPSYQAAGHSHAHP